MPKRMAIREFRNLSTEYSTIRPGASSGFPQNNKAPPPKK